MSEFLASPLSTIQVKLNVHVKQSVLLILLITFFVLSLSEKGQLPIDCCSSMPYSIPGVQDRGKYTFSCGSMV